MPLTDNCPFCGSSQTFDGRIKSGDGFWFRPNETQKDLWKWIINPGIQFGPSAHICAECGKLWSSGKPSEIRDYFESYGTEPAQAKLQDKSTHAPPDYPPPRLPTI